MHFQEALGEDETEAMDTTEAESEAVEEQASGVAEVLPSNTLEVPSNTLVLPSNTQETSSLSNYSTRSKANPDAPENNILPEIPVISRIASIHGDLHAMG